MMSNGEAAAQSLVAWVPDAANPGDGDWAAASPDAVSPVDVNLEVLNPAAASRFGANSPAVANPVDGNLGGAAPGVVTLEGANSVAVNLVALIPFAEVLGVGDHFGANFPAGICQTGMRTGVLSPGGEPAAVLRMSAVRRTAANRPVGASRPRGGSRPAF